MTAHRLLIVSDSHLSARTPEADANWGAFADHVEAVAPDLVVHAGDLTLHGIKWPEEFEHARSRLDALSVPWTAVPGNHDVGDNPGVSICPPVRADRVRLWQETIGADWWVREIGAWSVLGINAQLFGSNLPSVGEQWAWLDAQLRDIDDRPVVLVSHKPLMAGAAEVASAPPDRFVPGAASRRLRRLLAGRRVAAVVSGHVHQFRLLPIGDVAHVWAPSSWAVLPDATQPTVGVKRCGNLSLALDDDGGVTADLVEPPGMRQLTITVEVPDPFVS